MQSLARYTPGEEYLRSVELLRHNPGQVQVLDSRGHCVVLAGPGSGKTRCITTKAARMLAEDVRPPQGIACLTFNNECARELQRRLAQLGVQQGHGLVVGTVHSFCFRHIVAPFARLAGVGVREPVAPASRSQQRAHFDAAARAVLGESRPRNLESGVRDYRRTVALARARGVEHPAASGPSGDAMALANVKRVALRYVRSLRDAGMIDYEDMTLMAVQLVARFDWVRESVAAKFPLLLVDEYQDLGPVLHELVVQLLSKTRVRLLAVGDPDQSIYGFDGADPELLLTLSRAKGIECVSLPFNYRCGRTILEASEAALGASRGYKPTTSHLGTLDIYECPGGSAAQAELICSQIVPEALKRVVDGRPPRTLSDIAVVYSDRNDGNVLAAAAQAHNILVQRIDKGAAYEKTPLSRWLEECAAWCAGGWSRCKPLLTDLRAVWRGYIARDLPDEEKRAMDLSLVAFLARCRWTSVAADGVKLAEWLAAFYEECLGVWLHAIERADELEEVEHVRKVSEVGGALHGMSVLGFAGQRGATDHLNLLTLHSAKGLEFDVVILYGVDEGRVPSWADQTDEQVREARRRFYVGLTRARHEVHITYSGFTVNNHGKRFNRGPSRFLREIEERLQRAVIDVRDA
ncbi:MAG: ATP-dependent helicase [Gemmatimonadaceae bacterium]|nr:ATP-dependent helicase [Gemmatimonadaceae bacterium]